MRKNKIRQRLTAMALSVIMVVGMMPISAQAEAGEIGIQMPTPMFELGTESSSPTIIDFAGRFWYVIGQGGRGVASTSNTLTLLAVRHDFGTSAFNSSGYAYRGGNLQTAMTNAYSNMSMAKERGLVIPRDINAKNSGTGAEMVSGQRFWPLSLSEYVQLKTEVLSFPAIWWLRSPTTVDKVAYAVNTDGIINTGIQVDYHGDYMGVRPAFCLNLGSVFFTTSSLYGKGTAVVKKGLVPITKPKLLSEAGAVKFTVQSNDLTLTCTDTEARTGAPGDPVYISYSNATTTGKATFAHYVSCIIANNRNEVIYYGKLARFGFEEEKSGTASFAIPNLSDGNYTIKLFTEETNSSTDFSSTPISIPMTVHAPVPTVTDVTVNPSTVEVHKGTSQQFGATVTGTNNPAKTVTWEVSDKNSANTGVTADGLLTVGAYETAETLTVTATSTVDTSKSGTATVTVAADIPVVTVTSVTVKNATAKVTYTAGEWLDLAGLVVTLHKSNSSTEDVAFASFIDKGITVSPANNTVMTTGNTKVTITHTDSSKSVEQNITVTAAPVTVTSMAVKTAPTKVTYTAGERLDLAGLVVTLHKSDSSAEDVAFVAFTSNGITASPANNAVLTTGNTKVTITHTASGKAAVQSITVNAATSVVPVTGITLSPKSITLYSNTTPNTVMIATTVAPLDAADKSVSWQSSNTVVAAVDAAGKVSAVSNGTATITATTIDGGYTDFCTITVDTDRSGGGSGSGGSSGGGSSDNSSPVIVTPPAQDKPNTPALAEIKVDGKVDTSGNLTVAITDKNITDAIKKAMAEAKKNGNEANGVTLVLHVSTGGKTVHNVTVNLPKTVQDIIISNKIVSTIVVVDNPNIKIDMDLSTIKEINKQANADVNITATRIDSGKLTGNAKTAIGNRPVFDLKANYGNGKAVSSFGAGSVSVAIPYTLGANEKAGNVQAVYVDAKGKVQWLVSSVYDSVNKVLRFSTNHFSTYGVGYKQDAPDFTDIASHWAKDDIQFVVNCGLFSGTSATTFSPNTAMTRGMFVTALGRLANADVSTYKQSSFTDVKNDAYYMGYIEWANKNNIVTGISDGKFVPDQSITREQMAIIMSNYAKTIGFTLPKVYAENTFADSAKISTYAKDAVKQMQMAGVISGKNDNIFDPQGTATRAEVSAVMRRFVELAISSDTAWVIPLTSTA